MKWVGLCAIFLGFVVLQQILCRRIQDRHEQLEDWYRKMLFVRGEIEYVNSSLPELFLRLGDEKGDLAEKFLYRIGNQLEVYRGAKTFYEIWEKEARKISKELKINALPLLQLGKELSSGSKQSELKQLDWYLSLLNHELKQEQTQYVQRLKIVRTICLSAGAVLVLVLL